MHLSVALTKPIEHWLLFSLLSGNLKSSLSEILALCNIRNISIVTAWNALTFKYLNQITNKTLWWMFPEGTINIILTAVHDIISKWKHTWEKQQSPCWLSTLFLQIALMWRHPVRLNQQYFIWSSFSQTTTTPEALHLIDSICHFSYCKCEILQWC